MSTYENTSRKIWPFKISNFHEDPPDFIDTNGYVSTEIKTWNRYICIYMYAYICMYIYVYIFIYIFIYIHIYIYIYIYICVMLSLRLYIYILYIGGEWFWDRHTKLRKGIPESNFVTTINSMRTAQKRYPEDKAGTYLCIYVYVSYTHIYMYIDKFYIYIYTLNIPSAHTLPFSKLSIYLYIHVSIYI
jgi:hypothetical protein